MKLYEYEAKSLLAKAGVPVPKSQIISQQDDSLDIPTPVVLKVQVPVGGRGKAGGIKIVSNAEQLKEVVNSLFQLEIKGFQASKLLAEELLEISAEYYFAYIVDRSRRTIVMIAHKDGGVDIETEMLASRSNLLQIDLISPPNEEQVMEISRQYELPSSALEQLSSLLLNLWEVLITNDALLVEINPLVLTKSGQLICADAKIELDDAAQFRHTDWQFELGGQSTQFVPLSSTGNVASMANGAGLAMATVDAIEAAGLSCANFLDIGGGTNESGMIAAFERISQMPNVKAVVVNVFAGISRCDEVANAIVAAKNEIDDFPPLFIRLSGTNEAEGRRILIENGIKPLGSLEECVIEAKGAIDV